MDLPVHFCNFSSRKDVYISCFHLRVVGETVGAGLTMGSTVFIGALGLIPVEFNAGGVITVITSSINIKRQNQF